MKVDRQTRRLAGRQAASRQAVNRQAHGLDKRHTYRGQADRGEVGGKADRQVDRQEYRQRAGR